jgi:hypothetical protein
MLNICMDKEQYLKDRYRTKRASTKGRVDKLGNLIEFRLSFDEWSKLWNDAGLLPNREYILSRVNDIGHYESGNVYVSHTLLNVTEAMTANTDIEQKITRYSIESGYKRRIVKGMIKRGELVL